MTQRGERRTLRGTGADADGRTAGRQWSV